MFALLYACETDVAELAAPAGPPSIFVPLDQRRLARRVSIDLRGRLPTVEELASVPDGGVDALIESWMAEPSLEAHLVDVFAEDWLLRLDRLRVEPKEFGFTPEDGYAFTRSVGDEPAHLIAHVVAHDRPFTEIVTADYTLTNALLREMLPVELAEAPGTAEWEVSRYTDGRPANGILATSGLWLRYHTTIFNYNRGRAAALARLLLCYDIAGRPVIFQGLDDESTEGLVEAVRSDPGCISCHASMDPLAGTLFGFWPYEDLDGRELVTYHPERERLSEQTTGSTPGYFGTPVTAAGQLGPLVAADPRFPVCMARRAAERWWGRATTAADDGEVYALAGSLTVDWSYKDLIRAVLASAEYRAGSLTEVASEAQREAHPVLRSLSPNTLADVVEDATGFRWRFGEAEMVDEDLLGYRALLGGADGDSNRSPWLEPTVSRSLAIRRIAQGASMIVVTADMAAEPAERTLVFTSGADPASLIAGTPGFEAEVQTLHLRLHAVEADATELAAETALYSEVAAASGSAAGWMAVVTVLLRDPLFWTY